MHWMTERMSYETKRMHCTWLVTAKPAKPLKTYECEICHGINEASHFQCHYCQTIPRQYSILKIPAKLTAVGSIVDRYGMPMYIPVVIAYGAIRQTSTRMMRLNLRAVKADYYAEA